MYTVEDEREDLYEDEDYSNNKWDSYKGIIFKVIIIVLCIIVLIWLIKALNSNRNLTNINEIHMANVTKIRLAAEDYFFDRNVGKYGNVTLYELKNENLINELVDANNKLCDENNTIVNLTKDIDSYVMKVNLSCSTNDKEEKFYYHRNTLACLNCNGTTNMDGTKVIAKADENKAIKPISTNVDPEYSCVSWSNWSKTRVNDPILTERKKVMVQGVKYGTKTLVGNWSEYSTTPVLSSNLIEVETKVERVKNWSEEKTGTDIDTTNPNIRILSTSVVDESSGNCSNGYVDGNSCYSNDIKVSNLTYDEYHSGNYKVQKQFCEGIKTLANGNGLFVVTYINCRYNEKISDYQKGNSYTIYTYQELEEKDVTYYRYRVVSESKDVDIYTEKKYEEDKLPSGYVKVKGTEEVYYSYKITNCEK